MVDLNDLSRFRGALNSSAGDANYLLYLDADDSGTIDLVDLAQFRARFNHSVFPPPRRGDKPPPA